MTVSVTAGELMLPSVATIEVVPTAAAVARPFDPPALLIVAVDVSDELQVTDAVRFWIDPSAYVPVAVNCFCVPSGMVVFAGVVAIETSATGVTVSTVLPAMLPSVAEIVVVPTFVVVARPFDPPALLMEATEVAEEPHVTDVVRFCVELSV